MIESNRRRLFAGTAATVLSATLLLNVVLMFAGGGGARSHGQIAFLGFMAVLHTGLTIAAVFGVTQLVRRRADRLGLAGAALTCLGAVVGARIITFVQLALLEHGTHRGARAAMTALEQDATIVWVSIVPIGLMYPLGLMLLGIALIVARPVSRWAGAALAIGGFCFPLGRAFDVFPAFFVSDVLLGLAWGFLGWAMLTRRELWDGTREGAGGVFLPTPLDYAP